MKLLFLSSPSFADCDFPLVRAFQNKGVDVTYLIMLSPYSLSSTLFNISKQIPNTKIYPLSVYKEFAFLEGYLDTSKVFVANRTGRSKFSISYWVDIYNIRAFIRKGHFDIVHYSGFIDKFYDLAPIVTTFHDPFPHTGEQLKHQQKIYQRAVEKSKGIVLLNKVQMDKFCEFYSVDRRKILINSLGVYDILRLFAKSDNKPTRNNMLFFGRISPYKGLEYLCEAMILVRKKVPDATLTIAGKGSFYFDINPYKQLDYINIQNRHISMTEMSTLISKCEFCICPYTDATQSGVIMTSYSLGKPVIASAVGGLSEVVEDGKTGLLVQPKDINALANAMIYLLNNNELRNSMSDYIINEYFLGQKSWSMIADRYLRYYSDIIINRI